MLLLPASAGLVTEARLPLVMSKVLAGDIGLLGKAAGRGSGTTQKPCAGQTTPSTAVFESSQVPAH